MTEVRKTIADLVMDYFVSNPKQALPHQPVVDWVREQYKQLYGKEPQDPWRTIRRLHQEGKLVKVKKGVYKYDPDLAQSRELYVFSDDVRKAILRRDNYRCVVCGRGKANGVELHVDHRVPVDKGGTNTIDNGQTLCSEHNLLKKNYSQTEFGKRLIAQLYEQALTQGDERMMRFCKDILDVYDKHGINSHLERPNHH